MHKTPAGKLLQGTEIEACANPLFLLPARRNTCPTPAFRQDFRTFEWEKASPDPLASLTKIKRLVALIQYNFLPIPFSPLYIPFERFFRDEPVPSLFMRFQLPRSRKKIEVLCRIRRLLTQHAKENKRFFSL